MKISIENKICPMCNLSFIVNLRNKRNARKICCSKKCSATLNGKNNLGKKRTEEFKRNHSEKFRGSNNPFYGKTHTLTSIKKMNESSKWDFKRLKTLSINEFEKSVLDGLLLSDGSMNECSNVSSRLSFGFKYKETCEDIMIALPNFKFSPIWNNKGKYIAYHAKTSFYPELLIENKRWYINNKKIIPTDIRIDAISCYWWFIGDGYVHSPNVYLATNCFTKNDLNIVIEKLNCLGYYPKIISQNKLIFHRNCAIKFMNWLKNNNSIHKQYQYKWDNFYNNLTGKTCIRKKSLLHL